MVRGKILRTILCLTAGSAVAACAGDDRSNAGGDGDTPGDGDNPIGMGGGDGDADGDGDGDATPCEEGTFDDDNNSATACVEVSDCQPGTYETQAPSMTRNRSCEPCEPGSYTTARNRTECIKSDECPAGTTETEPSTNSSPTECDVCAMGTYCPGGAEAPVPCATGTWDDDEDPATECIAHAECSAGTYREVIGTATNDSMCTNCADGHFSTTTNAETCTAWTPCSVGFDEDITPSTTTDRTCKVTHVLWSVQGGSTNADTAYDVDIDSSDNLYITGETFGVIDTSNAGGFDAFVSQLNNLGEVQWTTQYGSTSNDYGRAIAVAPTGDLYVGGDTQGDLQITNIGSYDGFISKLSSTGSVTWTRQFGTDASDRVYGIDVDASGFIYAVGESQGDLEGSNEGGSDAFIIKCRVAPGDCSPRAPTDPDVRNSRIRLLRAEVRGRLQRPFMLGTGKGWLLRSAA